MSATESREPNRAALDTADREAPEVWRIIDRRDEHLERRLGVARRWRHGADDRVEERREIDGWRVEVHRRDPVLCRGIHDGRFELRFVRFQFDEEREHLVVHAQRIGARAIDLVDDDDRRAA